MEGISCPHCFDTQTEEQRIRAAERQKQVEISKALGRKHIGATVLEREQWREMNLEEREEANRKKGE
ncbi:hypothetical protein [Pelagicoccus sp. SDUM812005]|uniref:hypothetical protein n=1 Tax=Pelagicoccus sp. SDUM812005 TaxID=3041257 RepID=UPI00280EA0BC|nr:hypothetical protein [Pelagicoccus sp. SDUM812005]MDQ8182067.1 hypothetical protein [Pelagicoccus sp. SDUM812005]